MVCIYIIITLTNITGHYFDQWKWVVSPAVARLFESGVVLVASSSVALWSNLTCPSTSFQPPLINHWWFETHQEGLKWLTWPPVLKSLPSGNQTWQRNIQQSTPRFDDLPSERNLNWSWVSDWDLWSREGKYPIIIPTYPMKTSHWCPIHLPIDTLWIPHWYHMNIP